MYNSYYQKINGETLEEIDFHSDERVVRFSDKTDDMCSLGFVFEVFTFRFSPFLNNLFKPKLTTEH